MAEAGADVSDACQGNRQPEPSAPRRIDATAEPTHERSDALRKEFRGVMPVRRYAYATPPPD